MDKDKTQTAMDSVDELLKSLGDFSDTYDFELKDSLPEEVLGNVREKTALFGMEVSKFVERLKKYKEKK